MHTTPGGWTVIDRERAILAAPYTFNDSGGTARTFVARLADGRLLVVSPGVDMTDQAHEELAAYGEVGAIVAPTGYHHLGQAQWRQRHPTARHFASAETAARIKKKGAPDLDFEPIEALDDLLDDSVGYRNAPASKAGDGWAWATTADGVAFYSGDVLCNWQRFPGNFALNLAWKASGSGPGFKIFHLAQLAIAKDKKAVLRAFRDDVAATRPTVMVVCHGDLLSGPDVADRTLALIDAAL